MKRKILILPIWFLIFILNTVNCQYYKNLIQSLRVIQRKITSPMQNETYVNTLTLRGHDGPVTAIIETLDGSNYVSASWDKTLKIWDANSNQILKNISAHEDSISSLLSLNSGLIASASFDTQIKIFNPTQNYSLVHSIDAHDDAITSLYELKNGLIASTSFDKTIKIWNITESSFSLNSTLIGHEWVVSKVIQLKDGLIATCSWDQNILVWDPENNFSLKMKITKAHEKEIYDIKELKSKLIVSAGADKLIKLWDMAKPDKPSEIISGHDAPVNAVQELNTGLIATVSDDKSVRIWDINNNNLKDSLILEGHKDAVLNVNELKFNSLLATTSKDNTIKLWKLQSNDSNFGIFLIITILVIAVFIASVVTFFICKQQKRRASGNDLLRLSNQNYDF